MWTAAGIATASLWRRVIGPPWRHVLKWIGARQKIQVAPLAESTQEVLGAPELLHTDQQTTAMKIGERNQ
jgi:hypothetical protein